MRTGTGLFLMAVGAVLLFAVPPSSPFGLNLHVAGGIVIAAGIVGLLLPQAARGAPKPGGLQRWVNPSGVDDPSVHDVQSAAAADVTQIREAGRLPDPDGPARQHDVL
jgi:hypothetical protein